MFFFKIDFRYDIWFSRRAFFHCLSAVAVAATLTSCDDDEGSAPAGQTLQDWQTTYSDEFVRSDDKLGPDYKNNGSCFKVTSAAKAHCAAQTFTKDIFYLDKQLFDGEHNRMSLDFEISGGAFNGSQQLAGVYFFDLSSLAGQYYACELNEGKFTLVRQKRLDNGNHEKETLKSSNIAVGTDGHKYTVALTQETNKLICTVTGSATITLEFSQTEKLTTLGGNAVATTCPEESGGQNNCHVHFDNLKIEKRELR